jgi:hypothetical protein
LPVERTNFRREVSRSSFKTILLSLKEGLAGGDSAVRSSIPVREDGMFSKYARLCLLVTLVVLGLAPAVQAGTYAARSTARSARAHAPQVGLLQALWRNVSQIFEKEGASIDPSGIPHSSTGSSGVNGEGASIDPSGVPHQG